MLPAIQMAREWLAKPSARTISSRSAWGVHSFMDTKKELPPGYVTKVLPNLDDGGPGLGLGSDDPAVL